MGFKENETQMTRKVQELINSIEILHNFKKTIFKSHAFHEALLNFLNQG